MRIFCLFCYKKYTRDAFNAVYKSNPFCYQFETVCKEKEHLRKQNSNEY